MAEVPIKLISLTLAILSSPFSRKTKSNIYKTVHFMLN